MHEHHDSPEYRAAAAEQDKFQAQADELSAKIARYNELVKATNKQWFTGSKEDEEAQNLLRPYLDEIAGGVSKNLDEDAKAFADKTEKAGAARDVAIAKAQDAWNKDVDTGNASGKERVAASKKAVDEVRDEFNKAKANAHDAAVKATKDRKLPGLDKPNLGGIDLNVGRTEKISGTFSGAAAGMIGGKAGFQLVAGKIVSLIDVTAAALTKTQENLARFWYAVRDISSMHLHRSSGPRLGNPR